jgi:hypothetical protein
MLSVETHPLAEVPLTVYTVVSVGAATILEAEALFSEAAGDHTYLPAPDTVSRTVPSIQSISFDLVIERVGLELTLKLTTLIVLSQPELLLRVSLYKPGVPASKPEGSLYTSPAQIATFVLKVATVVTDRSTVVTILSQPAASRVECSYTPLLSTTAPQGKVYN